MHSVFVYGTLKAGFPNHHLLPPSQFVEACTTVDHRPLVIAGDWYTPTLIDDPGVGRQVIGELYSLDRSSLESLDVLEGVGAPLGFTRMEIRVDHRDDPVWAYVKPPHLVLQIHDGPLAEYPLDPRYVPGEQRDQSNRGFGTPPAFR